MDERVFDQIHPLDKLLELKPTLLSNVATEPLSERLDNKLTLEILGAERLFLLNMLLYGLHDLAKTILVHDHDLQTFKRLCLFKQLQDVLLGLLVLFVLVDLIGLLNLLDVRWFYEQEVLYSFPFFFSFFLVQVTEPALRYFLAFDRHSFCDAIARTLAATQLMVFFDDMLLKVFVLRILFQNVVLVVEELYFVNNVTDRLVLWADVISEEADQHVDF